MNDPYVENEIQPEDMPLLAEISEEDAHAMAMQYADEQSDEEQSPDPLFDDDEGDEGEDWNDDDDGMTDAEADADVLRGAGMGTDEDYGGMIGGDSDLLGEW